MLQKISLGTRIFSSFLLIIILTIGLGIFSVNNLTDTNNNYKQVIDAYASDMHAIMDVELAFANVRQTSRGFVIRIAQDPSQLQAQAERLRKLIVAVATSIDTLVMDFNAQNANPSILLAANNVQKIYSNTYKPEIERMMTVAAKGDMVETVKAMDATRKSADELYDAIEIVYNLTTEHLHDITAQETQNTQDTITKTVIVILIITALSIVFAFFIRKMLNDKVLWYESILDAFAETPISVTDLNKKITFINHAATALLGKKREELLGKQCYDAWQKEICNKPDCGIECLKNGKNKSKFDVGSTFFKTTTSYVKNTSGHNVGHIEVIEDVSKPAHRNKYMQNEVKKLADNIKKLSEGVMDCDFEVEKPNEYTKSEYENFSVIANNLAQVHKSISLVVNDAVNLANAFESGEISVRADTTIHKGSFKMIMEKMNHGLEELVKPLRESIGVLEQMAKGDLTTRMAGKYHGYWVNFADDINNFGLSLVDLIAELTEAIHTTASASAEISSTTDSIVEVMQLQSQQTDNIATAMHQMSQTVADNAKSANITAEVAKDSGIKANDGAKIVRQTVEKMTEIAEVVTTSAKDIAKLGESSKKIGEIIGVIDDIADQTNLLSLNAAIEAARAGEQGRGFAVVADSVGKLAVSTASATKEIAGMIKGIQRDTEQAVQAMERGTHEVQTGIELADKAGVSLNEILAGTSGLLGKVNQIAVASEEQTSQSEEISQNITSISKATASSVQNISDVSATANQLAQMTDKLTTLIAQFTIK